MSGRPWRYDGGAVLLRVPNALAVIVGLRKYLLGS